ncbi:hypothetical protein [Thioalkalivibrio sp. XN8]|uniref:hypothetical protein n=1 Tax=Thioalkalivibrio sp. XN8 TaxID=2712863 RepID=UPI001F10F772|nr:hypothetical protein [Thioalkalivibrio sp. XN8]
MIEISKRIWLGKAVSLAAAVFAVGAIGFAMPHHAQASNSSHGGKPQVSSKVTQGTTLRGLLFAGPVERISANGRRISILGTWIEISSRQVGLLPSDYVAVFGSLSSDGGLRVSRVAKLARVYAPGSSIVIASGILNSSGAAKSGTKLGKLKLDAGHHHRFADWSRLSRGKLAVVVGTQPTSGSALVIDGVATFSGDMTFLVRGIDGSGQRGIDGSGVATFGIDGSGQRGIDGSGVATFGIDGSGQRGIDGSGVATFGIDGSGQRGIDGSGVATFGIDGSGQRGIDGSGVATFGIDGSGQRGIDGSGVATFGIDGSGQRGIDGSGVATFGIDGSGQRGIDGSGVATFGIDGSGQRGIDGSGQRGIDGSGAWVTIRGIDGSGVAIFGIDGSGQR